MGVAGEILSQPGADGPLGPSLAVRDSLERIAFDNTLSAELAGIVALRGVEAAYTRRGELASRVAVTAILESPVREDDGEGHLGFLGHMDEEARLRAAKIAGFFNDVSSTRVRTSRNPLARKARLRLVTSEHTGYRYMDGRLRPGRMTDPAFLEAFEEGYMQEAERRNLGIEDSKQGLAIIRSAPRKIRGVNIGSALAWYAESPKKTDDAHDEPTEGTWLTTLAGMARGMLLRKNAEEAGPEPKLVKLDAQAFLTEHGVVLPLLNEESVNGLMSGFRLPQSAASLMESTRIRHIAVLSNEALPGIFAKLMDNVVDSAMPKF